jgi:hypothetical protein
MSIEGLLVGLVVLALALGWITAPLTRREKSGGDETLQKQRERLTLIYDRVLTNIRDLDEDYSTGKMGTDDYQTEREIWVGRGVQVLKTLDRLNSGEVTTVPTGEQAVDRDIDDEIEAAISAYRSKAETQT